MAKMLALAYPLAVFTLFLPFFAFFNLFSPQPKLKSSPKQQKQPKTPIQKGEELLFTRNPNTERRIIGTNRTCWIHILYHSIVGNAEG
jgi:hypothetical protein